MTLNTGIFDVSDPQNPDRVYSAALLCRMMAKQIRDGIVHEDGNEMAVTVTDPPAMTVLVGTGTAMVQGRFCENDAALTLAVPTAHATYPRIDRVVVRLNASPGRTIDIVVKPGTAAPEPAAPTLTRTAETWELSLAQVRVEAGATLIQSAKITDERGNVSLCGVAAPVYVPSTQLEVVGAVDMQGKALTGLPVPNAATDAARKGYVDSELAAKITGFGISQIAIDADKNWQGKEISNVIVHGTLKSTRFTINPGSEIVMTIPDSATIWTPVGWATYKKFKIPGLVGSASFALSWRFNKASAATYLNWRLLVDGVQQAGTTSGDQGGSFVQTSDLTGITNNSVIEIQCGVTAANNLPDNVTIDQIKVIGKCDAVLDTLPICTVTNVA